MDRARAIPTIKSGDSVGVAGGAYDAPILPTSSDPKRCMRAAFMMVYSPSMHMELSSDRW